MLYALLVCVAAATAPASQPLVAEELQRYYKHENSRTLEPVDPAHIQQALEKYNQKPAWTPSWEASIPKLRSSSPKERRGAVNHLLEVAGQSLKDEKSGTAAWRSTPYWGSPGENPARELRRSFVDAMDKAPPAAEFVPLIRWMLRDEAEFNLQERSVELLGKIDGKEAADYRRELASEPHPNALVVGAALDQLCKRKAPLPMDVLKTLCHHHRKVIRENARKLNTALNGPDPGPFDSAAAFRSPAVRKIMDELESLMIDLPSKNATFVEVTVQYLDKQRVVKDTATQNGWLVSQDANSVTIYTPYGRYETLKRNESRRISESETIDGAVRNHEIEVTAAIKVAKSAIDQYVKQIVDIRTKGNKDFELSSRGGLTGQFEGEGASLPEMILAAWLDRAGREDLAARVLLPALDTLYEDHSIIDIARERLGDIIGYRMLVAFDGERDYGKALNLARELVKHYPSTRFYKYARGLCDQLPRRMDDFKSLKLPTPDQWARLKSKLSRQQEIDFLCQRLRLLNRFQMGQPGGYDPFEPQYAEPCGLSDDAAWGQNKGKTVVINPLVELGGNNGWLQDLEHPNKGLELSVADIPTLAPWLREDWYEPTVSFWRDFAADRYLTNTRSDIARLIDGLAHRDLCHERQFPTMTDAQKNEQIRQIIAWAKANEKKSDEDLIVESVASDIDNNADWRQVEGAINELVKLKNPRAADFVEHYLRAKDPDEWKIPTMLDDMYALDKPKAVDFAKSFLPHNDPLVRMKSALIILESGDKQTAVPIMAAVLRTGSGEEYGTMAVEAVQKLLAIHSEAATAAAAAVLLNPALRPPNAFDDYGQTRHIRATIVTSLAKARHPEGYNLYLDLLDATGNNFGQTSYAEPPAWQAVLELLDEVGKDDPELQKTRDIKEFEVQRQAVRKWVLRKAKGR